MQLTHKDERWLELAEWTTFLQKKKKKSGYAEMDLCPISQAILNQPHGSKTMSSDILAECEWKVCILKCHLFFLFLPQILSSSCF